MIRPRTGDFLYTPEEMDVMLEDVRMFKRYGVRGIVCGILTADGRVDVESMKRIVDQALPLEVCFHRAFDMTKDVHEALQDILNIRGISRVLTSGHGQTVLQSLDVLKSLYEATRQASEKTPWILIILPGSGVGPDTVGPIVDALLPHGLQEIHLSGGGWIESKMKFRKEGMAMGEWAVWNTNEERVRQVRRTVDAISDEWNRTRMKYDK